MEKQPKTNIFKHLKLAVVLEDVLKQSKDGKKIFLGENEITLNELSALREEAKFLEKTRLWSVLTNTISQIAKEKMFENAESFDDMFIGKATLYTIDLMKKMVNRLRIE